MIRAVNAVLLVSLASFTAWGYGSLPERIPIHFDLAGTPNGWGSRVSFLILPAIGIATIGLLYYVLRFATRVPIRNPTLLNIPDKKRFLELPEHEQRWVMEPLNDMADYMVALLSILFLVIQVSMYRAAHGQGVSAMVSGGVITTTVALMVIPLVMVVKIQKRVAEAVRRHTSSGVVR